MRDEFKLNQHPLESDSAWERSSLASGTTSQHDPQPLVSLSSLLPQPKNHWELSEEVVRAREREVEQAEDERRHRELEEQKDEDMEDVERRL
jgi:hypothetical protein